MLRKDRECSEPEFMDGVLADAEVLFLAFNDSPYPYCIPVNFVRTGSLIYIHSALAGHKLDLIAMDSHVAFSAVADVEIRVEKSTTYYRSVCGLGLARVVEDAKEKQTALDLIAIRYGAHCKRPAPPAAAARVSIIRIDIESMTGKRNLP